MNPHIRGNVHEEDGLPANDTSSEVDSISNNAEAEIGDGDVDGLAGAEDGAGGLEVAHAQPAAVLALLALGTGRDVKE